MSASPLTLILYDLRSTYNVGAILRTADAVGVSEVITVGTTPYPELKHDTRPPHIRAANTKAIAKIALGAEQTVPISYRSEITETLTQLRATGYTILALEQSPKSVDLFSYQPTFDRPTALIVGPEVEGIGPDLLRQCDMVLEIPMRGQKESLNVSVAAGIALYALTA